MYNSNLAAIVEISPAFASLTKPSNKKADDARDAYQDAQAKLAKLCSANGVGLSHVQANKSASYAPTKFNECRDQYITTEELSRASGRALKDHEAACKAALSDPQVMAQIRARLLDVADTMEAALAVIDASLNSVRKIEGALVQSKSVNDALRHARGGNRLTTGIHQTDASPDVVKDRLVVLANALPAGVTA